MLKARTIVNGKIKSFADSKFSINYIIFIPLITTMTDPFAIKVYSICSHDLENLLCHFFDD